MRCGAACRQDLQSGLTFADYDRSILRCNSILRSYFRSIQRGINFKINIAKLESVIFIQQSCKVLVVKTKFFNVKRRQFASHYF